MRKLSLVVSLALLGGCNGYQLDPVKPASVELANPPAKPFSKLLAPQVMLVVDRSGSMADSDNGSQTQVCASAGQQAKGCKWDELLTAVTGDGAAGQGFVNQLQALSASTDPNDLVQVGLVTFSGELASDNPGDINAACKPGVLQVPLGVNAAASVSTALESLPPAGATPTASSLQVAGSAFSADASRPRYVVLLTDGEPNCNPSVPLTQAACGGDKCTSLCDASTGIATDARGCLDEDGTVAAVTTLASQNIKTFVIGFGSDAASGSAYQVLNAAALAGGEANPAAARGGPAYYQASNSSDLQTALNAIIQKLQDTCPVPLNRLPASNQLVDVSVTLCNGTAQPLQPSQWAIDPSTMQLNVTDVALCKQMNESPPTCPALVNVTYVVGG